MDECEGTEAYGTANGVEGESSVVPEQWAVCPGVVPGAGDRSKNVLLLGERGFVRSGTADDGAGKRGREPVRGSAGFAGKNPG